MRPNCVMEQRYEKTVQFGPTPCVFRVLRRHGQTHRLEISQTAADGNSIKLSVCEEDIGAFIAEVCAAAQSLGVGPAEKVSAAKVKLAAIREKYPRAYEPWTPEEDAQLREEMSLNLPIKEIAKRHGRNTSAIESRLEKLNPNAP